MSEIEQSSSSEKKVVVVADDEPSARTILALHLRKRGFEVVEASDGDEAWERACQHLPCLILLDVMMPGMSGWEVCRRVRETVSLVHTGVIVLTGIGVKLNEMTSPLYGADAYLDKPIDFAILDRTIEETLANREKGVVGRPDGADRLDPDSSRNGDAAELEQDEGEMTSAGQPHDAPSEAREDECEVQVVNTNDDEKAENSGADTEPSDAGQLEAATEETKTVPGPTKASPRRSGTKKAAKKAGARKTSAKKAPKKAVKKTAKKVAKKTVRKAAKKAPKKAAKKTVRKAAKKAPKKAAKKTVRKAAKKAPKKAAKKTVRKAAKKAPKKAAKKASKKRSTRKAR